MVYIRSKILQLILPIIVTTNFIQCATIKDIFTTNLDLELSENYRVPVVVRVPRETTLHQSKTKTENEFKSSRLPVSESEKIVRRARDSKYYPDRYGTEAKTVDRSLKPEDNPEDSRAIKGSTALGKRCSTCDGGYSGSSYSRGRDVYDRYYDRDPYSSGRDRYDRYDRYDRDRYPDRYDDYDRDSYRGRNRFSTYDRYEPRDRYYDRGMGYENRGGFKDYRDDYYSPYSRDRYDPYDDIYSRGYGYDSMSRGGGYSGRPDYYGGYAKGYSYGDRDRYGGYGGGYGSGQGGGYGSYSLGGYGSYGSTSGYGSSYGGSRSRNPYYDYDSSYRPTSYLYERPSSTTTDMPKSSDGDSNTGSSSKSSSSGRSK